MKKWLALATMTTRVTSGYSSATTRTQRRRARKAMVSPHQRDQPMCIEGMAANWLETLAMSPEAIEPQVWCLATVSMKSPSVISRGGANG
jgi:hypothetical protein